MKTPARDLRVRTKDFALRIIRMTGALPRTNPSRVLGDQILRSGTSVGANYREAYRSRSRAEFAAKCGDCLKELEETDYWLELLTEATILPGERLAPLQRECSELIAIFVAIVRKARQPETARPS